MTGSSFGRLNSFGIGAPATLQKLKSAPAAIPAASNKVKSETHWFLKAISRNLKFVGKHPRLIGHSVLVVAAGLIVFAGASGRPALSRVGNLASSHGYGAYMDKAAVATAAAAIASETHLAVADEATKTANSLNAQVSLPTVDDAYLAKNASVTTSGNVNRGVLTYSIQNGDTIAGIAEKFNVTSDTVKWANSLTDSSVLKPGQNLSILPISGLTYTIKNGDTAATLASKYQSDADQIISFNNLEVKGLVPGQEIIIPDGVLPNVKPATTTVTAAPAIGRAYRPTGVFGNGYDFGYCTWYVAGRRAVPGSWGNANTWYWNARAAGYATGRTPRAGAIAWTSAGYYGHVAYVESVSGSQVLVSEMNYNGNWDRVTYRWAPASSFLYIY